MDNHIKILVATDYSVQSLDAERYAVNLAADLNASLLFVHVLSGHYSYVTAEREVFITGEELNTESLDILREHAHKVLDSMGKSHLVHNCIVSKGNVGKAVNELATSFEADMTVIGIPSHSSMSRLFPGNRSWHIARYSSVPLLAIPSGSHYSGFKRIVVASDYRDEEVAVISYSAKLAEHSNGELTVLHIENELLPVAFKDRLFERFSTRLSSEVKYPWMNLRAEKYSGNLAADLGSFCDSYQADCLVMCPVKALLIERLLIHHSVTRDAMSVTSYPLLMIPEQYKPSDTFYMKLQKAQGSATS